MTSTQPFDFTLLQHTQQFGLQCERHFSYFIKQDSAVLSQFEFARIGSVCTRKRSTLVAEQHGFKHIVRDSCAIDGNKGLLAAR